MGVGVRADCIATLIINPVSPLGNGAQQQDCHGVWSSLSMHCITLHYT
jgi:hypothetical protein